MNFYGAIGARKNWSWPRRGYGRKEFMIDTDTFVEERRGRESEWQGARETREGDEREILLRKLRSPRRGSASGPAISK